jgi:hypothetical protein
MGESRGLRQLTRPEPPTPAEQLDAAMRYMQARYAEATEQLAAQLAAMGRAMAEALVVVSSDSSRGVRAVRGDPTGDPPLGELPGQLALFDPAEPDG